MEATHIPQRKIPTFQEALKFIEEGHRMSKETILNAAIKAFGSQWLGYNQEPKDGRRVIRNVELLVFASSKWLAASVSASLIGHKEEGKVFGQLGDICLNDSKRKPGDTSVATIAEVSELEKRAQTILQPLVSEIVSALRQQT